MSSGRYDKGVEPTIVASRNWWKSSSGDQGEESVFKDDRGGRSPPRFSGVEESTANPHCNSNNGAAVNSQASGAQESRYSASSNGLWLRHFPAYRL